jgi:DNA polymerase zeta
LPFGEEIKCDSRDCPVFYTRIKERSRLSALRDSVAPVIRIMEEGSMEEGFGAQKEGSSGGGEGVGSEEVASENLAW